MPILNIFAGGNNAAYCGLSPEMHFTPRSYFSFCLRALMAAWLGLGLVVTAHAFDHTALDGLLRAHVSAGRVDYEAVKADARLDEYLGALAATDLATLATREEQLAFWINAYNAHTLKLITAHLPLKSIRDIPHPGVASPWDLPGIQVGGRAVTLNAIENQILLAELKEPRIHYAIVCAAVSCPPLRAEAYEASRLEAQLKSQAYTFLRTHNRFDLKTRRAELSSIFKWFAADFGSEPAAVLRALAPYTPATTREALTGDPSKWAITYLDYDWSLNDRRSTEPSK